jgi:hypothetical protein
VDQERLAKLLDKAGYVDEVYELNGLRPAEIEIAFVPGGRAHSQWIRLSEVISSWTKRRIRPRKIVFVGDRDKDPHGRDVAEDFHYVNGKPPPGCEPYKPGVVPPTDEDLPEKSFERWMMKWFWANLEKPDELEEVEVEYFDSLEDYFKVYTQRVRAVYYTINPHRFHLAKFRRTAPRGSRVAFIACAATLARSDVRYLADAWAREILETYLAGFRVYGRSSVIPPQILKLMQEMERLARLN